MTTLADPTFASIILQRAEEIARRPAGARDPEAVRVQADSLRHLKEFTSALRRLGGCRRALRGSDSGRRAGVLGRPAALAGREGACEPIHRASRRRCVRPYAP